MRQVLPRTRKQEDTWSSKCERQRSCKRRSGLSYQLTLPVGTRRGPQSNQQACSKHTTPHAGNLPHLQEMHDITRQEARGQSSPSLSRFKRHANNITLGQNLGQNQPCRGRRRLCSMAVATQVQWYTDADAAPNLHPQNREWGAQASNIHPLIPLYQPPAEVPNSHNRRQAMTLMQEPLLCPT